MSDFCLVFIGFELFAGSSLLYFYWRDVLASAKTIVTAFPPQQQNDAVQAMRDRAAVQTQSLEALNAVEPPLLDCDQAPNADDREYRHWVPKISPSVDAYSEGCADGEAAGKAIGRAQAYTAIVDLLCLRAETPGKAAIEAQECHAIAALIRSVFPQAGELPDGLDHPTVKQLPPPELGDLGWNNSILTEM